MSMSLTLLSIVLVAVSGCPGLWPGGRPTRGPASQWMATMLMLGGAIVGGIACLVVLRSGQAEELDRAWFLPWGRFALRLDALSALFLLPVFVVPALGSIYGMGYWRQAEHPENGRRLRFFYGLLSASMAMVVLAHDAIVFLLAWEIMAIAAFFLITTEDDNSAARQAGWIYLIAAHLGTLCLLPMFGLLAAARGSFMIEPLPVEAARGISTAVFVLALVGFGLKAGIFPLHVWLPGAHSNAPSHVSALLSGVMLKMGVYGLVRTLGLFPAPPDWWGGTLLAVGAATGLVGIVYALAQHDIKRLLAYSSIENIGIIMIGVGLAAVGRARHQPEWIALGLGGALFHVWNHALFKPLLFFAAGSVIHGAHTRDIDRLGGLARRMPRTAVLFSLGAVAACGLPPLNGFVSELLIYAGLFGSLGLQGGPTWPWAAFAAPVLALVGGLVIACFVKAYGGIFLGSPRTPDSAAAHDVGRGMLWAMTALAAGCLVIGLTPGLIIGPLRQAVTAWTADIDGDVPIAALAIIPMAWISVMGVALVALTSLGAAAWRLARPSRATGTWDCGFAAPTPRMQYTASSFTQILVAMFRWALWPDQRRPHPMSRFPTGGHYRSHVPDLVLERGVLPAIRITARLLPRARLLQQGKVQIYVLYILVILIVLLAWG